MKKFDFYEFAGVLCPGAVVVFGLAKLHPQLAPLIVKDDVSLGDLGFFVILSYVAGRLVLGVGLATRTAIYLSRCCTAFGSTANASLRGSLCSRTVRAILEHQ